MNTVFRRIRENRWLLILTAISLCGLQGCSTVHRQGSREGIPRKEALDGVVARWVDDGAAADQVGLKEGDVLLTWNRKDGIDPRGGEFRSPLDVELVEIEEAPRAKVTIRLLSNGGEAEVDLPGRYWGIETLAVLSVTDQETLDELRMGRDNKASETVEIVGALPAEIRSWVLMEAAEASGGERRGRLFFEALEAATDSRHRAWIQYRWGLSCFSEMEVRCDGQTG